MSGVETESKPVSVPEISAAEPVPQQPHDSHDEEYESADDAYEDEEVEEVEVEEEVDDEEEEEERSPSQQEKAKDLDDDEDAKNPQFIPKRGYFYEHDDRTKTDDEAVVEEPKKEEQKKPSKEPNKWSHDLFNAEDQTPKSKEELSRAYGYDIFTEDQAPRARRRRRYGRGPNKYTRQWEDEEAYQKPRGGSSRGRGGGSRGRGNFRGTNRRDGDENVVEEEFPALPGSDSTPSVTPKAPSQSQPSQQPSKPAFNKEQSQRRGSGEHARSFQQGQENRRRNNDYDSERNYGPRGGGDRDNDRNFSSRGGGRGGPSGGRGRGRRNEFSNRNRYPARRDGDEEGVNENQGHNQNQGQATPSERERPSNRPRPIPQGGSSGPVEHKDNRTRGSTHSHQQTNGHIRDSRPKDSPLPSKPPFTNTEYTGSHSLTANRTGNRQQNQGHHREREEHGQKNQGPQSNVLAEKGFTDLRDVINAKRQQQQPGQSDRRSQMPPRLQQQQAQQLQQHPQALPHHHQQQHPQALPQHHQSQPSQHQMDQQLPMQSSGKSKRFSAQRQRQTEQALVSSQGGLPTSAGVPMGHVVTGSEQMVPSSVPAYPQAPSYYEGPQVYETSGSPVTVATVATNGTSVSPSLWTPHAYAPNAPYPSPPTGPQVPPPAFADHAAYLAAQQAPIYSAPPPFIQDPTMMNYNTGAPPFAPSYHPQAGYQGFPQVTPAPPPELYHAGVTYYNPQPQIQRQPPMMVTRPRTKTVLQLVEPPEKSTRSGAAHLRDLGYQQQHEQHSQSPPITYASADLNIHGHVEQSDLVQQFESVSLTESQTQLPVEEQSVEQIRKPSPLPEQESWSAQMDDTNDLPEDNFQNANDPSPHEVVPSTQGTVQSTSPDEPNSTKSMSKSPQPLTPMEETKKEED